MGLIENFYNVAGAINGKGSYGGISYMAPKDKFSEVHDHEDEKHESHNSVYEFNVKKYRWELAYGKKLQIARNCLVAMVLPPKVELPKCEPPPPKRKYNDW